MKTLTLLLMLSLYFNAALHSQASKRDIQGNWIKIKAEMTDGSWVVDRAKTHSCFLEYKLVKNIFCINRDNLEKTFCTKFKVNGDELSAEGVPTHIIEYLQEDTLILLEKNDRDETLSKRLYFVRDVINYKEQEKKYEDEALIATAYLCPSFQNSFSSYIYDQLKQPIKPCAFKGWMIIDRDQKKVNTIITENENADAEDLKKLEDIINKSWKYWTFKDYFTDAKYKIFFVGKALDVDEGGFENLRFAFFTSNYQDIKKDNRAIVADANKGIRHYNDALDFYAQGKLEEAIVEFTKAYELDETNLEAVYTRALLYGKTGNNHAACQDLKLLTDLGQLRAKKMYERKCLH